VDTQALVGRLARPALIGRDAVVAAIEVRLDLAANGHGSAVLLRGEAGIGKSRVVQEIAERTQQRDWWVLRGRAEEFEAGIPYSAIRDVFNQAQASDDPLLRERARIVLHETSGSPGTAAGAAEATARLSRVYSATMETIEELVGKRPLLLAVEDLHVADEDSLSLIRVIARSVSGTACLLLATMRPDLNQQAQDTEAAISRLAETDQAAIVDLPRMDQSEVATFVEAAVGAPPDPRLLAVIVEQSRGNPFFVYETLLGIVQAGSISSDNGVCHLTGDGGMRLGRRTAILHRIFQGRPSARDVAKILSVLGRIGPSRLHLLGELTDLPAQAIEAAFDGLVADCILVQGEDGGYEFTHPLVRATLYDDIGPIERRRLHREIANWLLQHSAESQLHEATRHIAESAEPGDAQAAAHLMRAADSNVLVAPLTAASWYQRAIEVDTADHLGRARLLARQARAYWLGARPLKAAAAGQAALPMLGGNDLVRASSMVINARYASGSADQALACCASLLAAMPGQRVILAQQAHILLQAGHFAMAEQAAAAALAAPLHHSSEDAVALCHLLLYADMLSEGTLRAGLIAECQEAEADLATGPRLAVLEVLAMVHADAGELEAANRVMAEANTISHGISATNIGGQFAAATVRYCWLGGAWDSALDAANAADYELAEAGMLGNLAIIRALRAMILADRGMFDQAAEVTAGITNPMPSFEPLIGAAIARRHRLLGAPDLALAALRPAVQASVRNGWKQWRHLAVTELVEAALLTGDRPGARGYLRILDAADARPLAAAIRLRLTALVDEDPAPAEEAITVAARHGLMFEEALAQLAAGQLSGTDDELRSALATMARLGAEPWIFEARRAMRARGLALPKSTGSASGPLNSTELRLAELVQQGLTNRQIAAAMHYSPKTVEVYLSRVYAKIGVSTRFALARAMDSGALTGTGGQGPRPAGSASPPPRGRPGR
jgi:DNA-binding NarL/FixJ family response regulator